MTMPGVSKASEDPVQLLVVDDEAPQMKALCETLRDYGYVTTGFTSAREALETLKERKFDLLLTDLTMPEMDGISLLRAAQQIDENLVGVMMTGHGTIDTAVEAMKAGALDYILKPFKLSAVLPVLARACTVRRLRLENAALERAVRARTVELEEANRELEAFSYSVSHDLRAPLRAIDGFSEILIEDHAPEMSEEARHLLQVIRRNAQRMAQLIADLLRFSKTGRQPLSQQTVDLPVVVQEVVEEIRKEEKDRDIEIRLGDIEKCVGDPALLRQVYTNLLSNAFKYTRRRSKAVIEIGCRKENGETVYYVTDNGAGFDMRHAEKLFGVFQRMHDSEDFEGTGVGLSIVQRIVQRHGGRIWAEAEEDKGAAFYFTLAGKNEECLRLAECKP
jgi:two-component system sensor histidine kinase/response regulator